MHTHKQIETSNMVVLPALSQSNPAMQAVTHHLPLSAVAAAAAEWENHRSLGQTLYSSPGEAWLLSAGGWS